MKEKTYVVKTLPQLIQAFKNKKRSILYAEYFSEDILNAFQNLEKINTEKVTYSGLVNKIKNLSGFENVSATESHLQYVIKGDIISIWPVGYQNPIRFEFFGEECEKLYSFDSITGSKISNLKSVYFLNPKYLPEEDLNLINFDNIEVEGVLQKIIFTPRPVEEFSSDAEIRNTDFTLPNLFFSNLKLISQQLSQLNNLGYKVIIQTREVDNLPSELIKFASNKINLGFDISKKEIQVYKKNEYYELPSGFISEKLKLAVFTDRELFGHIYLSTKKNKKGLNKNVQRLLRQFEGEIKINDYVVHEDYGIALYAGLSQEEVDGVLQDYLLLKYAEDDELYVPINQINKITKYIGTESGEPKLTRLGKQAWTQLKKKIKTNAKIIAKELVEHYAKRELSEASVVNEIDTDEYKFFVDEFEYPETSDQLAAINDIMNDLQSKRPMNRLLIGDVGFGKTEVAMRAAFKIVENGGQVAVLAPTTVLASQHSKVFRKRFKNTNFKIETVSRFKRPTINREIIQQGNDGKIDILIGTHRLLSSDVRFKNLQLLIIDEEQKFGVKQKEKIKKLNLGVHLLSVSATPIPRTLSMALSTIQDISVITEPPVGRKPIKTEIIKEDWAKAVKAIEAEVARGGQVYFVHNQVQSIQSVYAKLKKYLPHVRFVVGHGQMTGDQLDKIMYKFYEGKYDCLIATTIIENGLDVPNVNTIVIHNAQRLGLSQLYQLRGRVGRSERKAYCYLMYKGKDLEQHKVDKELPEEKQPRFKVNREYLERLNAMVENQDLGAGFRVASKDLEIRGAGNLLGEKQHGHISKVGYALYIELLAQEMERLKAANV